MHETEVEPVSARPRKPGRWVLRAAIGVFVFAVLIFGLRVWWFYAAVDAIEQSQGRVGVRIRSTWLDRLESPHLWRGELYFGEEIEVEFSGLNRRPPFRFIPTTSLNDSGLQGLAGDLQQLENLRALNLTGTDISNAGLSAIAGCNQLTLLDLSRTRINDAGLMHLVHLQDLRTLNLDNCNISDEGLRHLHGLQKLESLNLDGTQVTDEGVRGLKRLRNLRFLSLAATGITDEACEELRGAIPDLEILDD